MTKFQPSAPLVFRDKSVRRIWHESAWYFSVVDVIAVLTDSGKPRDYWYRMKEREDKEAEFQLSTICRRFKLTASDGKMRETDCANMQSIFRIIQSIPSKKAEPFKQWLAKVGKERLEEIEDPELSMTRMKEVYKKKGYPSAWIEKRVRGIAVRNELTDEWSTRGASEGREYAILTNEIMQGAFDMKVADYKDFKGLDKENLRDHMTDIELILTMLGEATTTKFTQDRNSQKFGELKQDAKEGGEVAGKARKDIETRGDGKVISEGNYV